MKIALRTCFLLAAIVVLQCKTFSQMREIYLDGVADNQIYKLSFYSSSEGFVAFRDWIGFTTDSGRTFTKKYITTGNVDYNGYSVNLTFGFGINGVKAFNKDTLIAYGDYGFVPAILYSTNGGNSFKLVFQSLYDPTQFNSGITDMAFPGNGKTGFATDADRVLKTTDKGLTWVPVYTSPGSGFQYLEVPDNNNVYALCTGYQNNKLLNTTNGGNSWQQIALPFINQGKMNYAHFPTANRGYLSMYDYNNNLYFYYTTSGGLSWTLQNNIIATPFACGKMVFVNDSTGFALSGQNTVYKTTDYGKVWEPLPRDNQYSYLNYTHNDLACMGSTQLWAGGGHGFLELNTNGDAPPLPKAFFIADTTNISVTNQVNLINYSKKSYQYQWFVNGTLISTDYNTSYTRNIYSPLDTIQLVVSNGNLTDTLTRLQQTGFIPAPVITSFSPASGTMGSTITITGNYFITDSAVSFGGIPAASFTVVSPTTITAVVGTGASGRIRVATRGGADSITGFTFIPPPPVISSISPAAATAGSVITITGNFFTNASAVSFGGVSAASFTVVSQTTMTAVVGAGASGNVSITTPTGTGNFNGFTLIPAVSITSFSPASGPAGTTVTITGNNFSTTAANNTVYFGGMKAKVTSASANSLSVTVPLGATYLPITVTTNGQTVSAAAPFVSTFTGGGDINATSFQNMGTYATGANGLECGSLGDIDGDGLLDVFNSNNAGGASISLFRNTSSTKHISFAPRLDLLTRYTAVINAFRDMNMDGKPDIVLTGGSVEIFKNNSTPGNMAFDSIFYLPGGSTNMGLAIDDIDGDGRPDVAAPTMFGNLVTVWRNISANGNLAFETKIEYATGDNPWGAALADLDGDKKPELIVCNYYDHNVSVYRNLSTPGVISFAPPVNFDAMTPRGLATGDIDGDGKIDLAIAQIGSVNGVAILRNTSTGAGNFSFDAIYNCPGTDPFSVQIADMDGDGRVDIVTPNQGDQTTSLYKNTGSPGTISFAPRVTYTTGANAYPRSAPLGDLDNDSKPDFVYVNYNQSSITVFRNRMNESFANAGDDVTVCSNDNAQIGTSPLAGTTYSWTSNPAGFTSTIANPLVKPVNTTTTYYLVAINNNTSYYDTVVVTVIPSPVANAGPNQVTCTGGTVTIGTAAVAGVGYNWKTAIDPSFTSAVANPVVSPETSRDYYLTVTAANGCIAKDTVTVTVFNTPVVYISANTGSNTCTGTAVTFTATYNNEGTAPFFQWQVNGVNAGTNSKTFTTSALKNGDQVRTLLTSSLCNIAPVPSPTLTMTVNPAPPAPVIQQSGNTLTSSAASGNQWYKDTVAINSATAQTFTPVMNGVYTVKTTVNGCTSAASNAINYSITAINSPVLDNDVTTAPNPVNEYLHITCNGNFTACTFRLLSVWGNVLTTGSFSGSYSLDMRKFTAGMYILQIIRNNTHEQIYRAILKQ